MKTYELSDQQKIKLEQTFLMHAPQDGTQQKIEVGCSKIQSLARQLMQLTKPSPEQDEFLKRLQEAYVWYAEAVRKHER